MGIWVWVRNNKVACILSILFALDWLYDKMLGPAVNLNIENWIVEHGLDDELVDGGREVMPFIIQLQQWLQIFSEWVSNSYFVGFLIGVVVYTVWGAILRLRSKNQLPANDISTFFQAFRRSPNQVIDDLESHNVSLQDERNQLQLRLDKLKAGGDPVATEIRVERADDTTSRYWIKFRTPKSYKRITLCLDLRVAFWKEEGGSQRLHWGRKTRHIIQTIEPVIQRQTHVVALVMDVSSPFEKMEPAWSVKRDNQDESLPVPPTYQKGAITFVEEDFEQEYRFIVMPRELNRAMTIIDQRYFGEDDFWADSAPMINLRQAKGLRELTTPEAKRVQ